MKSIITLSSLHHKNQDHIAIGFGYNDAIKTHIKAFNGVLWSATHKTFYVSFSATALHNLYTHLRNGGYYVDYSSLKNKKPLKVLKKQKIKPPSKEVLYTSLPKTHKDVLKGYIKFLRGKRLSENTVSTYGYFVLRFLNYAKDVAFKDLKTEHITLFIEDVITKECYSISSHRQCISAFKYLTVYCVLPDLDASEYKRPKKDKKLPRVVSKESIIRLIQVTKNLKHRIIISLLYSSGLRVGELLQLKQSDIDFERLQIFIRRGKGRKDRVVTMAEVLKPMLSNYIQTYEPNYYFIEGRDGDMYTASSVRHLLKRSCTAAGITPAISPHALRHSYATHMLENGVDIRHIQALLGHSKPETTMIYTHVAQEQLMQISNPLDATVKGLIKNNNRDKKFTLSGK